MPRGYQVRATPITIFGHLLFIAITTLVLIWLLKFREGVAFNSSNKFKIFNLHPLLMVIGFVLVAAEGIIAYKAIPGAKKRLMRVVHLLLHLLALASGILGVIAVFICYFICYFLPSSCFPSTLHRICIVCCYNRLLAVLKL